MNAMKNAMLMLAIWTVALLILIMHLTGCTNEEGFCPEPQLVERPHTCSFYLDHSEDVPNVLCRVSNVFHDPILNPERVLTEPSPSIGIWVVAKHRVDDSGDWCGNSYGAVVSQQYRPGWNNTYPDCVWVACSEFADISDLPE